MHLLNVHTRKLEYFGGKPPLYAILSHTWSDREVTFQDIDVSGVEDRPEFEKIRKTCKIAATQGFDHVWIDTCCIDKSSSAELSEAINSMYRWYQDAVVCFAYLVDVDSDVRSEIDLLTCRWLTRSWTLQELLAPKFLVFLDKHWREIGTKSDLCGMISEMTDIPEHILLGGDLRGASVAQKMSWASERHATRLEDHCYSLMGIFGVNMPLLYGEGEKAFSRLQEEIIRVTGDPSIFVWRSLSFWEGGYEDFSGSEFDGPLAPWLDVFRHSGNVVLDESPINSADAVLVNHRGVHLQAHIIRTRGPDAAWLAVLPCRDAVSQNCVAIHMQPVPQATDLFDRVKPDELEFLQSSEVNPRTWRTICVRQNFRIQRKSPLHLCQAAACGNKKMLELLLRQGADPEVWDSNGQTPLVIAAANGHLDAVKVLLDYNADIESKEGRGRTALVIATEEDHIDTVRLLLDCKAETESKNIYGQTPLVVAASAGRTDTVRLLLDHNADIESKDRNGETPLARAAGNGRTEVVRLLLDRNADIESEDKYQFTPLLHAAGHEHESVVKILIEKGPSWKAATRHRT